jgi:hypothetical protein
MRLWIVKLNDNDVSKPLPIDKASALADMLVEFVPDALDLTIEFYAETIGE